MRLILHLDIYLFPMLLLAIIFISMQKDKIKTMKNQYIKNLLFVTFILMACDLATWVLEASNVKDANVLIFILNTIYFMLCPLVSAIWMGYTYIYLYGRGMRTMSFIKKGLLFLPIALYWVICVTNVWTNLIFNITKSNDYERGELFTLPYASAFYYIVITLAMLLKSMYGEVLDYSMKEKISMCAFTVMPTCASIIQMMFYDVWLSLPATALGELMIYMMIQNRQITKDALTGINNRGCFDTFIRRKIEENTTSTDDSYLFLLDIDKFKRINDVYGHVAGDKALVRAANILKKCFSYTGAFIARYGGDEFCIICRCDDDDHAKMIVNKIHHAFKDENESSENVYKLSVSVGYAPIVGETNFAHLEQRDQLVIQKNIIKQADNMMYEQKKRSK